MLRRSSLLLTVLVALFVWAPSASAQSAPLVTELRRLVDESGLGDEVGISVVNTSTGRPVFQFHAERPMNPASNQKLVTAYCALRVLGAQSVMRTAVYGNLSGGRVEGGLAIRGYGDPDLTYGDFLSLARDVRDQGVTRVDRVIVDAGYFDDQVLPALFEQQPNEVAAFRAPISALAVNRNAYQLRILPGSEVGAAPVVRLLGAPYFDVTNRMTTSEPGRLNVIADQRDAGDTMSLRLSGTVPVDVRGVSYRRRIENPLPWVGHVFAEALRANGIRVPEGRVSIGSTPSGAAVLATHESAPVSRLIHQLGKWSDNFVAEMLFRRMGAERHAPGRNEDGVAAIQACLTDAGVETDGIVIHNGSGLFTGNRIPPQRLANLLTTAYRDPAIRSDYLASLAVGGVDGTLRRRLRDLPAPRIVRAKTGTLAAVIGLSGYVLGPAPDQAYAFSFLANDVRGRIGPSRHLADDIARAIAAHLHGG
ncbi:MAG: D-alanyl-D-alanine carboxypeptidase/D-alanyl-D-alanine-endopeptidase [Sandaracinaceae bacterium]